MKPVPIAVVGLGRTGWRNHLMNLQQLPQQYTICGVCDSMESRRKEAEETFHCPSFFTLDDLLANSGAEWVVIATPQTLHRKQTISALRAGKNVICEKPMALNLKEATEMEEVARETGKSLSVFHSLRYAPDFKLVKRIIDSGKLGRILMIKIYRNGFGRRWDWQTLKKYGGGNLANLGPHVLDHALCLMGPADPRVVARAEAAITLGDADDHVKILLRAPNAPLLDIELSSADAMGAERWKVYGTYGGLVGDGTSFQCKFYDPEKLPKRTVVETPPMDRTYDKETIPWVEETLTVSAEENALQLPQLYYSDLFSAINAGNPPPISTEHSVAVMRVMEKIHENSVSDDHGTVV